MIFLLMIWESSLYSLYRNKIYRIPSLCTLDMFQSINTKNTKTMNIEINVRLNLIDILKEKIKILFVTTQERG